MLREFEDLGDRLTRKVLEDTLTAIEEGYKVCRKCNQNKPADAFLNPNKTSGRQNHCTTCNPITSKKKGKKKAKIRDGHKKCPSCKKVFPTSEFNDKSTQSGRRRYCGPCKQISAQKQREATERYMRAIGKWR